MESFAARVSDLEDEKSLCVNVGPHQVLLGKSGGEVFCIENICSHRALSLEGGRIRRGSILCPHHGVPFDLKTGRPKGTLTDKPLRLFDLRIDGDQIFVQWQ